MGKESEGFLDSDTVLAISLLDDRSHIHPAVPVPTLYQEPPKSAIFFFLLTFQGLLPAWVHLSPTLGVKIQPPQQLYWQQSPSAPSPHLADFTKELYNSVTWESQGADTLISAPSQPGWQLRDLNAVLIWEESHPQVSVPETPP